MNRFVVTDQLQGILDSRFTLPTTVMWNRLEGRPVRKDFSRALKAEVRDPLWLIARQAQLGEFKGDDGGSPVTAKVAFATDSINFVKGPKGAVAPYDPGVPLEAIVEARGVPLERAGRLHNADLRLALGRRWQKLLDRAGLDFVKKFRTLYSFIGPDPAAEADFPSTAAAANWQLLAAVAERAIDGGALLAHLSVGKASDNLGLTSGTVMTAIDDLGDAFLAWANRLYFRSELDLAAWSPRHLEYGVGLSAPAGEDTAALAAPEYHGGRLDWFHFDAVAPGTDDAPAAAPPPPLEVTSFIPTPAQFEGMPNTRYWTFEEGVTNFGDIKPDTTDIAKLLLIEFGLVFANDWFLLPIELPVGSLTRIRGLAVTNVFGERILIEPAVTAAGPVQSWQMFRLTDKGAADDRLFLPATTPAGLESAPVEAVEFVRDEVSNMVWGLERIVQTADGASRPGREVALELHDKFQAVVVPASTTASTNSATVKYVLMTSVAEHWIPFIPVHVPNDNREIQLQRAAMPRLLDGAEGSVPAKIRPRTALLREGLEGAESSPYFIAEEEVERAGTIVETRWQRCRWTDGQVVTWLGHRRMTGRGEAWSGLAFDLVLPKRKA